jgi:hypothetical protein
MTELTFTADAELPWAGGFWLRLPAQAAAALRSDVSLEGPFVDARIEAAGRALRLRWDLGRTDPDAVSISSD